MLVLAIIVFCREVHNIYVICSKLSRKITGVSVYASYFLNSHVHIQAYIVLRVSNAS